MERCGFDNTAPGTAISARFNNHINATYKQILSKKVLKPLKRPPPMTVSSISGSPFLALPFAAKQVFSIADRTNNWLLHPTEMERIRRYDPGLTLQVGNPYAYAVYNMKAAVLRQPPAASALTAVSTSASDSVSDTVYVEGYRTGGYPAAASVALNGLTPVTIGAYTDWITVSKFYIGKTGGAAGFVTLSSGATSLGVIPVGAQSSRYALLHLYPVPSAVVVYTVDAELLIETLTNEAEEPILIEDYHWLIAVGAAMKEMILKEKYTSYGALKAEYNEGMSNLMLDVNHYNEDGNSDIQRYSQLGPFFSPGS